MMNDENSAVKEMPVLLRSDSGGVVTLTLNRPKQFNSLSEELLTALQSELGELAKDESVRAIVIAANGKAFCAGHDLKQMRANNSEAYYQALFAKMGALMTGIMQQPQPVIARVQGVATAAGCQLVASCDMAVAAEGTRFGVNGVNIGLFCSTPMVALTRNVAPKQAFEMLTTGEFIDAARALDIGLVNRVAPHEALEAETMKLAETVAAKLSAAVKIGKRAFYDQIGLPLDQAYSHTGAVMVENMLWRDTNEGISAFIEKRPPDWQQ